MLTQDLRKLLEQVHLEVSGLSATRAALRDRVRWLKLFDLLDELKEDLRQGRGKSWPPAVREAYVKVRTGLRELFDLQFAGAGALPVVYCRDRLTSYRDRLRKTLTQLTQASSTKAQ